MRRSNEIRCWDLRYADPNSYLSSITLDYITPNQRIAFDIVPYTSSHLVTGAQDGTLRFYNSYTFELEKQFKIHPDCSNGIHFHPIYPYIATCSGERHFEISDSDSDSDFDCEDNGDNDDNDSNVDHALLPFYSSIGVWRLPHIWCNNVDNNFSESSNIIITKEEGENN